MELYQIKAKKRELVLIDDGALSSQWAIKMETKDQENSNNNNCSN
jgi:hypothetical protein